MGFFSKSNNSNDGILNVIRCDLPTYLVWKWRPEGHDANTTKRENAIRWGSSLRVKDGEMAIFIYNSDGGQKQDVIVGPFDETLKTANLPILSSIIGLAYNGGSPFQAEVYFINLANNIQIPFGVPYFDVFDPRYPDLAVPVAVRGTFTFNISDYKTFIKNNRLINFELDDLKKQIKSAAIKYVKNVIIPLPTQEGFSLMQIESRVLEVNEKIEQYMRPRFSEDFGINLRAFDIDAIEINKTSEGYKDLKSLTIDIKKNTTLAQSELNIRNMQSSQKLNEDNLLESMRIQREEMQRAQRLHTEQSYLGAHALDQQTDVMKTAAQSMGKMNSNIDLGSNGGGLNPAGMMTSMMMGGAVGQQLAGMMNQMGQTANNSFQQSINTPPPVPQVYYYILIANQQQGPYNTTQLMNLIQAGTLLPNTYVWKAGMASWGLAKDTELAILFTNSGMTPPPTPPVPPTL